MMLESIETLSADAYLCACNCLFGMWAKAIRRSPKRAYVIRRALTTLHRSYSSSQACPIEFAEQLVERTIKAAGYYHA